MMSLIGPFEPKACPWCGQPAEAQVEGHYVKGWTAYVACGSSLCGARGPDVRTATMSNDESVARDKAVELWNRVRLKAEATG